MNKSSVVLAVALVGGACGGDDDESVTASHVVVSQHTSDGANLPGTAGFYFYTPLVETQPNFQGTFNDALNSRLQVLIANTDCTEPNETGSTATTYSSVQVYPNANPPQYKVVANSNGLLSGNCYRILPTLDGEPLGFRDVQVTSGTPPAGYRQWKPGSNLAITFRIEDSLDADSDGVLNHVDNCPDVANPDQADSNSNGVGDVCEVADQDGDGVPDASDNCPTTHNPGQENGDNDGAGDACDGCPADGAKVASGICGCGFSDADADGDGYADGPGGPDATAFCGDFCPSDINKQTETQTTGSAHCGCGVADTDDDGDGYADLCNDGCPTNAFKSAAGLCGCDAYDNDSDGDGTADNCPNVCVGPLP